MNNFFRFSELLMASHKKSAKKIAKKEKKFENLHKIYERLNGVGKNKKKGTRLNLGLLIILWGAYVNGAPLPVGYHFEQPAMPRGLFFLPRRCHRTFVSVSPIKRFYYQMGMFLFPFERHYADSHLHFLTIDARYSCDAVVQA